MKKEIWRSFEGKLGTENQYGWIVYDIGEYLEIESLSAWNDTQTRRTRISKEEINEEIYKDMIKLTDAEEMVRNGIMEGQYYSTKTNKWYKTETIRKIQEKNNDKNWQKYI